jgi:hypothetical protein
MHEVNVGHGIFEQEGKTHHISKAYEAGVLRGPIPKPKAKEEQKVKNIKQAALPDIPGLTAEADAEIRRMLQELAKVPSRVSHPSIATKLVAVYGDDIRAARKQRHGWAKLAKVFRTHGLKISEKLLKTSTEQ